MPPIHPVKNTQSIVRLGELLGALSHALDLTEGQPQGHCVRCCWIGMQVAEQLNLPADQRADLYFTLLLKDLGCSSNAARICQLYMADDLAFKRDFKTVGTRTVDGLGFVLRNAALGANPIRKFKVLSHVLTKTDDVITEIMQTRCDRGAEIARLMRFPEAVARGISGLDEHWDGRGRPYGLVGDEIPLFSRIALMAQIVDVFTLELGAFAAEAELSRRAGKWFDPALVAPFLSVVKAADFAETLMSPDLERAVFDSAPAQYTHAVDDDYLDEIAHAFARVIDAKSPFTHGHSERVARYTQMICRQLGHSAGHIRWMSRAALLHDMGKLGVSNTILDKPDKLTDEEFAQIKKHPTMGFEILNRIDAFQDIAPIALAHHERLDGRGYPNGWSAAELSQDMRILTVADIFDALTADRPYRAAMPLTKAYGIMGDMVGTAIDPECFAALQSAIAPQDWPMAG